MFHSSQKKCLFILKRVIFVQFNIDWLNSNRTRANGLAKVFCFAFRTVLYQESIFFSCSSCMTSGEEHHDSFIWVSIKKYYFHSAHNHNRSVSLSVKCLDLLFKGYVRFSVLAENDKEFDTTEALPSCFTPSKVSIHRDGIEARIGMNNFGSNIMAIYLTVRVFIDFSDMI